ncbi:MAG TPA: protein kinase [Pyrinomonadaceae bacterium]|nr:protein kinase [Pyrinomonadaceae bacterium]
MLHCPTCGKSYSSSDVQFCLEDDTPLQADPTIVGAAFVDPLIGFSLDGKYQLEEPLGVGGMGTVYRARHLLIDRVVAVKVLNQRLVEDDAARERFHREAKAAGRIQHLNAVAVTDFGQTPEGYVYIVMELLEGRTLREILAKEAPLETARAVSIMLQTAAAVSAAHEAGVIHRDLKPANILVTQNADVPAIVKVLDFGIAKLAVESTDEVEPKNLTQVGAMIGTPRYMSPEQCSGLPLTPASDVYSLGVILYEMLTGMTPFSGSTPLAIALKHASEFPRPPKELVASIPDDLEQVVLHALEKQPRDRPADAAVFRNELLETAERLGLEHAELLINVPDLNVLRDAGVESPSGRLVVDLSRLRETKALTSGSNELTVIGGRVGNSIKTAEPPAAAPVENKVFSRLQVELNKPASSRKWLLAVLVFGVLLLSGVVFFVTRPTHPAAPLNMSESPVPTVSTTPTPTPSPSPLSSPSPRVQPSPSPSPQDKHDNKQSKVGSFLNKVKGILKKPFKK